MSMAPTNTIFYGPPGSGKTFFMQRLLNDYIDYTITDDQIKKTFTLYSFHWLLVSLILLQNRGMMKSTDIQEKVTHLKLNAKINVSAVLDAHNVSPLEYGLRKSTPRVFVEYQPSLWFVDRIRLIQYKTDFFAKFMSDSNVTNRYIFITFHQSFAYEDFVEGIRPTYIENTKSVDYSPKPGVFKTICEEAEKHPEKKYAIFIDEINRGNISEIFGELISLIETDKRKGQANELSAVLPYSKDFFVVPSNLDIFGTMNSSDKSIASIDIALRRRFKFYPILPSSDIIKHELDIKGVNAADIEGIDLIRLFNTMNRRIELLLDSNHLLGHSYFLDVKSASDIALIIHERIIPLLEEYFYDDIQKIQLVFNDLSADGQMRQTAIYRHFDLLVDDYFPYVGEYLLEDKKQYYVNPQITKESLIQIYDGI